MPNPTSERWNRLKEIFAAAMELPAAERAAFVRESCGDDSDMQAELMDLVRSAGAEDDFIETSAATALGYDVVMAERDLTGRRLGPYRIIGLAGRGGLSQVYRAVREGSGYEHQVAIKVLRSTFDTEALLRRFSAERRMLAALSHPNIAHFMDGGATDDGMPYLVMEFVDGLPLETYCERNALPIEARIDLFRVLCGAVHHVHQHLMVHGDIKGGNVLVTQEGVVKLLDFGIAKLMTPEATTGAPATLMMLTPEYASPEQLRGESITTASDVYSLGALLYRLLTGAMPHGSEPATPVVMMQRIDAGVIELPADAARRTGGEYAGFETALRGDLSTIMLKALKVEPSERYGSAQQLADDLHRWLRGYPVEARPDSASYRFRKWVNRNRAAAALSALAITALLGGIAATSWQARVATVERQRAEQNAARAERSFKAVRQLSSVFLADVYTAIEKIPGSTEARQLLVDNTLKYLKGLEQDAQDSIELRASLAAAYERLGRVQGDLYGGSQADMAGADDSNRRALAIRRQLAIDSPTLEHRADLLRAQTTLVASLLDTGRATDAVEVSDGLVSLAELILADPAADRFQRAAAASALIRQGELAMSRGDSATAIKPLLRAREVCRQIADQYPNDRQAMMDLATSTGRLGQLYAKGTGQLEDALRLYREATAAVDSMLRANPADAEAATGRRYSLAFIGDIYNWMGRPREALAETEAVLPDFRRAVADDANDQLAPLVLGLVLVNAGKNRVELGNHVAALRDFDEAGRLLDPKVAATVPDFQAAVAVMHAGRARAHLALARDDAAREKATAEAKQALALLQPLADSYQVGSDVRRQIERLRADLEMSAVTDDGRTDAIPAISQFTK